MLKAAAVVSVDRRMAMRLVRSTRQVAGIGTSHLPLSAAFGIVQMRSRIASPGDDIAVADLQTVTTIFPN